MSIWSLRPVPADSTDSRSHRRILAGAINNIVRLVQDAQPWSPVFAGATTPGVPVYSPAPSGRYWKIASLVLVQFSVVVTGVGGAAGNATITGLPFPTNAAAPQGQGFLGFTSGITVDATKPSLSLVAAPGGSTISVLKENGAPLVIGTDIAAPFTLEGFLLYSV